MRKLIAVLILLCIAYFVGGWIGVRSGWLPQDLYFTYAGVVGGLASVLGLLSFVRPPLSQSDIEKIGLESLKKVAETSEELKKLDQARTAAVQEVDELEAKRREMEFSVRKASLSLFLREQRKHHENSILKELRGNTELASDLKQIAEIDEKLATLKEEIEKDPNVDLLKDIISSATTREESFEDIVQQFHSPALRSVLITSRVMFKYIEKLIKA